MSEPSVSESSAPPAPPPAAPQGSWFARWWLSIVTYFTEQDPTFWNAFSPALLGATFAFVRSPFSNYIFDEQEALLANPYVNGVDLAWRDFVRRDFWGLPPDRSIGSYRPLPNLVWRAIWQINQNPWLHHWVNVVLHAVNASLLAALCFAITRRRGMSWLVGGAFLFCALLTEAVTGVVGIADVMGGLGILLALHALRLPLWAVPLGVFGALAFSLGSKESGMVGVPLVAWTALVAWPHLHPTRPGRRYAACVLALAASVAAFAGYVAFRKHFFPVSLPAELQAPAAAGDPWIKRVLHDLLRWFAQPRLPSDPINNPLILADTPHRIAGALRVYWRGLVQVVFPARLSGDYSFPQEPIPSTLYFPESILGALALAVPPCVAVAAWLRSAWLLRRADDTRASTWSIVAIALAWVPVAYFPQSNIPVLLPTVRAERFWYLPALGTALLLGLAFAALWSRLHARHARWAVALIGGFLGLQALRARVQAIAYTDDLTFWKWTRWAVPNSCKAQLNYGVMVGARGRLEERLVAGKRAMELAPQWPMGHVYYGDTLCRLHRAEEAWQHYVDGFEQGPNEPNLIALGLQCLWDEKVIEAHHEDLLDLSEKHPGTWLSYLASDIVYHGEEHGGVDPQYRPRGYNDGPKKKKK